MKNIIFQCEQCKTQIDIFDCVCSKCESKLEDLDEKVLDALEIKNIKPVGGYVSMEINGKTYEFLPGTPVTGKYAEKEMTAAEIVEYLKRYIAKSPSIGQVMLWIKKNLITKKEAGIGKYKGQGIAEEDGVKVCGSCKNKINDSYKYCPDCGNQLNKNK